MSNNPSPQPFKCLPNHSKEQIIRGALFTYMLTFYISSKRMLSYARNIATLHSWVLYVHIADTIATIQQMPPCRN